MHKLNEAMTSGNCKTELSRIGVVGSWKLYCGSWKLEALLWKLEAMKEVFMNLDLDDVIDRVMEKSKLLRTVLTA